MILTRFCSIEEYNMYAAGMQLINTTDHRRERHRDSSSVGFCFTPDPPTEAWQYLKGIVDYDVCMVLDIDDHLLNVSYGTYVDYSKEGFVPCQKREYCIKEYSKANAQLIRTLYPKDFANEFELDALEYFKMLKKYNTI